MRSATGESAQQPVYTTSVSASGAGAPAGTQADPTYSQTAPLPAGTDRSGSIATGGTAQDVASANTSRRGLDFQNTSDTEMRVTENGTAATAATGYLVAAGGRFNARTNRAISVFCAITGKTFASTEW